MSVYALSLVSRPPIWPLGKVFRPSGFAISRRGCKKCAVGVSERAARVFLSPESVRRPPKNSNDCRPWVCIKHMHATIPGAVPVTRPASSTNRPPGNIKERAEGLASMFSCYEQEMLGISPCQNPAPDKTTAKVWLTAHIPERRKPKRDAPCPAAHHTAAHSVCWPA